MGGEDVERTMGTALGSFGDDDEEEEEEDEEDDTAAVGPSFFSASFSFRFAFLASFSLRWLLRKTWSKCCRW